jgi:hypothetical protein
VPWEPCCNHTICVEAGNLVFILDVLNMSNAITACGTSINWVGLSFSIYFLSLFELHYIVTDAPNRPSDPPERISTFLNLRNCLLVI